MDLKQIKVLFDEEKYNLLVQELNPYNKTSHLSYEILYFLKSWLVLNNFTINKNIWEVKKLFLYYWYLEKKIIFEGASFSFKNSVKISLFDYENDIKKLSSNSINDYITFFNLFEKWNDTILNPSITSSHKFAKMYYKVRNFEDFFYYLLYRYSQLYAFKWLHFAFFKWLTNQIANDYF